MITTVVADDDPTVAEHLRAVLEASPAIEVVGVAHDGAEAVELVVGRRPDVVVLDVRMPGVDGLTALRRLRVLGVSSKVPMLSALDDGPRVREAMAAGADGFLLKATAPDELAVLVVAAATGHHVMSARASAHLVGTGAEPPRRIGADEVGGADRTPRAVSLTPREEDVLVLLGRGLSNAAIAGELHLTESTVKGYVSRIIGELACTNRTQAALLAHEVVRRPVPRGR